MVLYWFWKPLFYSFVLFPTLDMVLRWPNDLYLAKKKEHWVVLKLIKSSWVILKLFWGHWVNLKLFWKTWVLLIFHSIYYLGSDEAVFETTNVPHRVFNETLALIADIPLEICPERGRLIHCLFEIKQNKKSRFFVEQLPFPELSFVFPKMTCFSGNTPVPEEIRGV